MSSILDALEKLESAGPPTGPSPGGRIPRPPRRRPWAPLLLVATFAAGVGVTAVLLRGQAGQTTEPAPVAPPPTLVARAAPEPPAPAAEPTAAAPAPAVGGPAPAAPTPSAAPPAAVPAAIAAAPKPAAPPPRADASASFAPRKTAPAAVPPTIAAAGVERPWAQATPAPSTDAEDAPPPPSTPRLAMALAARPAPIESAVPSRPPAGAPPIRLSFLLYSAAPDRRTVALSVSGSGLTTLHEGEDIDGFEVVRIFPDRAELRWQGETFVLRARD